MVEEYGNLKITTVMRDSTKTIRKMVKELTLGAMVRFLLAFLHLIEQHMSKHLILNIFNNIFHHRHIPRKVVGTSLYQKQVQKENTEISDINIFDFYNSLICILQRIYRGTI